MIWSVAPGGAYATFEATTALSAVGAAAVLLMITLEYRHSPHSTYISSATLSVLFCVDVVKTWSFFMRDNLNVVAGLSAATALPKLVIIILQKFPRPLCNSISQSLSQEATCGFWNQTLAIWVNPTMRLGRRQPWPWRTFLLSIPTTHRKGWARNLIAYGQAKTRPHNGLSLTHALLLFVGL